MQKKKILITGARGGMGRDGAFAFAGRGHTVFATTETDEQARELEKEVKEKGLDIRVEKLNLLEKENHQKAVEFAPDVLINNAAVCESGPLAQVPMKTLRSNFETNVFGTIELTQKVVKGMLGRGSGRIIIFSSVGGKIVIPYLGPYNMTKFALEGASDALRQELAPHNIQVSVILPGAIDTGFNERMNASKYAWFDETSMLWSDRERIKKYEKMLVESQHQTTSITRALIHAVESRRPKTRYVRPLLQYKFLVFFATLIPDRLRDWLLRKMAGI